MVTVTKCEAGGWWLAREDSIGLAATAKSEAEARARVNRIASVYRAVMERGAAPDSGVR